MNNKNKCISKEEFVMAIKARLKLHFGQEYEVKECSVRKNNGIVLTGITVTSVKYNISPTIYAESFYARYKAGEEFDELINEMIIIFESNRDTIEFDSEAFTNYNKMKERIVYKLVNKKMNLKLLDEIPYFDFLDMAIVFYYMLDVDEGENATILIKNEHLKIWKQDKESLLENAKENAIKLLGYEIKNLQLVMRDILYDKLKDKYKKYGYDKEMIDDILIELLGDRLKETEVEMYVLSNKKNIFGASCILNSDILSEFSERLDSDLIILPSSIHEVIIVPKSKMNDISHLQDMVREVNETQVAAEEVLSDSVYIFRKEECKVELLCG